MKRIFLIIIMLCVQNIFADYLFEKELVVIGKNPAALKTFFSVEADSMLIINELQTNSYFQIDQMYLEKFKMLKNLDKFIFWGGSIQNLKPVKGGVVIFIEFAGKIEKIFSKIVVFAENSHLGKTLIEKKYQSKSFQRFFTECYENFRVIEPADNIFLANPETFFIKEKNNSELLTGMMVSNLVKDRFSGKNCVFADGISLSGEPTEKTIEYISKLKPKMFGLVGDKKDLYWIRNEKNTSSFGYKFERFFGSWSFEFLKNLSINDVSNIDMLGYCPQFNEISEEVWAERIDFLKKKFKGKKLLVGPCVNLYGTINQKTNSADYTGFEISNETIGRYIRGDYDNYIKNTLNYRDEIGVFITYYQKFFNADELSTAMKKIINDGHTFGITTTSDNYHLFEIIFQNSCMKAALYSDSLQTQRTHK